MAEWATWPQVCEMSLDEVDLLALLIEANDYSEPEEEPLEGGIL